jgi:hypothetical protein
MKYLIYKITNNINKKYYIGMHRTKNINDGYMGSGTLLKLAIKKYGIHNFNKEILFNFDNEKEMVEKEKELIKETINDKNAYNIAMGGWGGDTLSNHPDILIIKEKIKNKLSSFSEEEKSRMNKLKIRYGENNGMFGSCRTGKNNPNYGNKLTKEQRDNISRAKLGKPITKRKIPEQDSVEILRLYEDLKFTIKNINEIFNDKYSGYIIRNFLKENNKEINKRSDKLLILKNENLVIDLYVNKNFSVKRISYTLKIPISHIKYILFYNKIELEIRMCGRSGETNPNYKHGKYIKEKIIK